MDSSDATRIPAYLLRRMSDSERDAFEARLLEAPELLERVRAAEAAFLAGTCLTRSSIGLLRVKWLVVGAAAGAALVLLADHLLL